MPICHGFSALLQSKYLDCVPICTHTQTPTHKRTSVGVGKPGCVSVRKRTRPCVLTGVPICVGVCTLTPVSVPVGLHRHVPVYYCTQKKPPVFNRGLF